LPETENQTRGLHVSRKLAAGVSFGTGRFSRKQQAKKICNRPKFFSVNSGSFLPGSRIPPHPFPGHRAFAFRTVPSGFSPSVPVAQRSNRRLGFSAIGMGKAGRNVGC